jgi:hypothetical protein
MWRIRTAIDSFFNSSTDGNLDTVIASHRGGAKHRPMTGSAQQSISRRKQESWIASAGRPSQWHCSNSRNNFALAARSARGLL